MNRNMVTIFSVRSIAKSITSIVALISLVGAANAAEPCSPYPADSIELVDEHDTRCFLLRRLEQVEIKRTLD